MSLFDAILLLNVVLLAFSYLAKTQNLCKTHHSLPSHCTRTQVFH